MVETSPCCPKSCAAFDRTLSLCPVLRSVTRAFPPAGAGAGAAAGLEGAGAAACPHARITFRRNTAGREVAFENDVMMIRLAVLILRKLPRVPRSTALTPRMESGGVVQLRK